MRKESEIRRKLKQRQDEYDLSKKSASFETIQIMLVEIGMLRWVLNDRGPK